MSASVADDMIRSYFDCWQRLEEEKRTISDDLKEMFAEARGNGLDTKALRAVFREQVGDKAALQEFDAICDLYRSSLNAPRAGRAREGQSYAEVKGGEVTTPKASNSKASDPETGDLGTTPTDTQEQPETVSEIPMGSHDQCHELVEGPIGQLEKEPLANADAVASVSAPHSPSDAASSDAVAEPQAPRPSATATLADDDVPAFIKRDYVLRPHCLNPSLCAGAGSKHCHACLKARDGAILADGGSA